MHEFKGKINSLLAKLAILMQTLKGFSNALRFVHTWIPLCAVPPGVWYRYLEYDFCLLSYLFQYLLSSLCAASGQSRKANKNQ